MQTIELLAPAKNLASGIAAIKHGADAVYIGASHHGARAAAGNSLTDIEQLCAYAHSFRARVYVTLNTIIYDDELEEVKLLMRKLAQIKIDAILVQDMALVELVMHCEDNDPLAYFRSRLHASTQTDNRSAEKVAWLNNIGFSRVVLARELSVNEIKHIHQQQPDIELEAFVHGALCVSYSGQCYASQYCFNRSANRGECAQFCRMKFDLTDSDGKKLYQQLHLLSLKDMCQINHLEQLLDSGVVSLKIEGRLKDITYVKNVVAAYSTRLNEIIAKCPNKYKRSSMGHCQYDFTPNLAKTFNRGYTTYFLNGRIADISSPATPKAIGQFVGKVKAVNNNNFTVAGIEAFANGDGLCFIGPDGQLTGFRVNKVVGNKIFPLNMPDALKPGIALYRNNDKVFEDELNNDKSAVRLINVNMHLCQHSNGLTLTIETEEGIKATASIDIDKHAAQKPQRENMQRQLGKLGNTIYKCINLSIDDDVELLFVPSSILTELRRHAVEELDKAVSNISSSIECDGNNKVSDTSTVGPNYTKRTLFYGNRTYLYNIANHIARHFYAQQGLSHAETAFEVKEPKEKCIMQCRYCIRYALGYCAKNGGKQPTWHEPLFLTLGDGRRFRLQFHCSNCQMNIYADD